MTKRLSLELDPESPLHEEMLEQDPPVMDNLALSRGYVNKFVYIGNEFGVDGNEIARLLGVENPEEPELKWNYHIDNSRHQLELYEMFSELLEAIESQIGFSPAELDYEHGPEYKEKLDEDTYKLYMTYRRAMRIKMLLDFAHENNLTLTIG